MKQFKFSELLLDDKNATYLSSKTISTFKFKTTTKCILSGLAGTTTIAPTTIAPATLAPTIGQTNFCTPEQPCSENSGDCNSNDDCQAGAGDNIGQINTLNDITLN